MKKYDHIIIGFGKGGKTIAGVLAARGKRVAIIEQSEKMFGGTCINMGCIPSKFLEERARISKQLGGDFKEKSGRYQDTIEEKRRIVAALREKNYNKAILSGVDVIVGQASFADEHVLQVKRIDETSEELWGDQIYINTGAYPFIPDIPGLKESRFIYTSESIMELDSLPKHLVIIGGGYIGMEFASYYANFGSDVTILQNDNEFLSREDEEVRKSVLESFLKRGIRIMYNVSVTSITDKKGTASILVKEGEVLQELNAEAVLVATGRRPYVDGLCLENAGVKLTQRGAIAVDENLRTSVAHIWAAGDVTGGLQFTYISLDDSRILKSQLLGDKSRTINNRGEIPYSIFIDPPLSRIGLTEKEALDQGYKIKIARLSVAAIPKTQVVGLTTGVLKVIIDNGTNLILGAHLFCAQSHEMINLFKIAMDAKLPYSVLRDTIYTHPTMSEAINDLLSTI